MQHSTPMSSVLRESRDSHTREPLLGMLESSGLHRLHPPGSGVSPGVATTPGEAQSTHSTQHHSYLAATRGTGQSLQPSRAGQRPAQPKPAEPQGPHQRLHQLRIWPLSTAACRAARFSTPPWASSHSRHARVKEESLLYLQQTLHHPPSHRPPQPFLAQLFMQTSTPPLAAVSAEETLQFFGVCQQGQRMATAGWGAWQGHVTNLTSPSPQLAASRSPQPADSPWRAFIESGTSPVPTGSQQVLGESWSEMPQGECSLQGGSSPVSALILSPGWGSASPPCEPHCSLCSPTAAAFLPSSASHHCCSRASSPTPFPQNRLSSYLRDEPTVLARLWQSVLGTSR